MLHCLLIFFVINAQSIAQVLRAKSTCSPNDSDTFRMLTHILRFISLPWKTRWSLIWILTSSISFFNCLVYARQFAQPFGCEHCPLRSWPRRMGRLEATWRVLSGNKCHMTRPEWFLGRLPNSEVTPSVCGGRDEMERAWWPGDHVTGSKAFALSVGKRQQGLSCWNC